MLRHAFAFSAWTQECSISFTEMQMQTSGCAQDIQAYNPSWETRKASPLGPDANPCWTAPVPLLKYRSTVIGVRVCKATQ